MPIQLVTNLSAARRYFVGELADGTTLAKLVIDRIDFASGRFFFELPQEVEQHDLNFKSGNWRFSRKEGIVLARLIKSFIRDPASAVLFQETQMGPSELPGFDYAKLAVLYDREIYWSVKGPELANVSDDEMLRIVSSASFYPFSAFFYLKKSQSDDGTLEYGDLEDIVNALVAVAVGAFDDRSFLIWWREESRPFPLPTF